jgi:hypothetical protein
MDYDDSGAAHASIDCADRILVWLNAQSIG